MIAVEDYAGLPANISGIAQLQECKIEERGVDKYWFYACGSVVEPEVYRGKYTAISIPLFETHAREGLDERYRRISLSERFQQMTNELRKLLGSSMPTPIILDCDELEELLREVRQMAPLFRFHTWQAVTGITIHAWDGIV